MSQISFHRQKWHKKIEKPSLGRSATGRPGTPTALAPSPASPENPAQSPNGDVQSIGESKHIFQRVPITPAPPAGPRLARGAKVSCVAVIRLLLGAIVVSDLDGFHPNNEGQREVAQLFLRVIVPKLGVRQPSLGSGQ
jgi:hypothetical protein